MLLTMGAQVKIIKDCHKREKLLHWWPKACHNLLSSHTRLMEKVAIYLWEGQVFTFSTCWIAQFLLNRREVPTFCTA